VRVSKDDSTRDGPSAFGLIRDKEVDFVINVAREYDSHGIPDGAQIRRLAVDLEVPLITDLMLARAVVHAIVAAPRESLAVLPWRSYA
jgi:carbamoyl-phosphate synthase large subunit